jgi:hypothetical protein
MFSLAKIASARLLMAKDPSGMTLPGYAGWMKVNILDQIIK